MAGKVEYCNGTTWEFLATEKYVNDAIISGSGDYVPSTIEGSYDLALRESIFEPWNLPSFNLRPQYIMTPGVQLNFKHHPDDLVQSVHGWALDAGTDKFSLTYNGLSLFVSQDAQLSFNVPVNLNANINAQSQYTITGLKSPVNDSDAATKGFVIDMRLNQFAAPNLPIDMSFQRIENLGDPLNASDAVHKTYVDNKYLFSHGFRTTAIPSGIFNSSGSDGAYIGYEPTSWGFTFCCNLNSDANGYTFFTNKGNTLSYFMTFKPTGSVINSSLTVSGLVSNNNGGELLNLYGVDHGYIQFFPRGSSVGRKAWIGYGTPNGTDFTISNEDSGKLNLYTAGKYILEGYPTVTNIYGNGLVWASASDVNTYISAGGQPILHGTSTTCSLWAGGRTVLYADYSQTTLYAKSGNELVINISGVENSRFIDIAYPIYMGSGMGSTSYKRGLSAWSPRIYNADGDSGRTGLDSLGFFDFKCDTAMIGEIWLTSSQKLKTIVCDDGDAIELEAINTIETLPFFQYHRKDDTEKRLKLGLVAEKIWEVQPHYVDLGSTQYVPNILQWAQIIQVKAETITIELEEVFDEIIEGDQLSFYHESQGACTAKIISHDQKTFILKPLHFVAGNCFKVGEKCHVYGTYETCPSIHKNELFELNLIATKNILRRLAALEQSIGCA